MKCLKSALAFAILGIGILSAGTVFAAAGPEPENLPLLSAPMLDVVSANDAVGICPVAIVEDVDACMFGVLVGDACPPRMAAVVSQLGPRLLASSAFLVACLDAAAPGRTPPD